MILYVETNFVMELAYEQASSSVCEDLIADFKAGRTRLVLPAFCLSEPLMTNVGHAKRKREFVDRLNIELTQLERTRRYRHLPGSVEEFRRGIIESIATEKAKLDEVLVDLSSSVEIAPLTDAVFRRAIALQGAGTLEPPQDAIVLASVLEHLAGTPAGAKCFVTSNSRDFASPDIEDELGRLECKLLFKFEDALGYTRANA
jgi:hypothetical protein